MAQRSDDCDSCLRSALQCRSMLIAVEMMAKVSWDHDHVVMLTTPRFDLLERARCWLDGLMAGLMRNGRAVGRRRYEMVEKQQWHFSPPLRWHLGLVLCDCVYNWFFSPLLVLGV